MGRMNLKNRPNGSFEWNIFDTNQWMQKKSSDGDRIFFRNKLFFTYVTKN